MAPRNLSKRASKREARSETRSAKRIDGDVAAPRSSVFARLFGAGARKQADSQAGRPGDGAKVASPTRPSGRAQVVLLIAAAYLCAAFLAGAADFWRDADMAAFGLVAATIAVVAVATQIRWAGGAFAIALLSFAAQLHWAAWIDPQPLGELGRLWQDARRFAAGLAEGGVDADLLYQSPSPSALALYGAAIFAFGEDLTTLRFLAAGLWALQTWLVAQIALEVRELRERAFAAALIFGLSPSLLVFGALPSVEALFGAMALGAVYVVMSHRRRGLVASAAIAGVLLGAAYLALPAGAAILCAVIGVFALGLTRAAAWRERTRMAAATGAALLGFVIGAAPQAAINWTAASEISIAPGPAIGYQLLIGTDRRSGGAYAHSVSAPALTEAGFIGPDAKPLRDADATARAEAFGRVADDPLGYLAFAATDKLERLWGAETALLAWSFNAPSNTAKAIASGPWGARLGAIVEAAHIALLGLALIGVARLSARGGAVHDPMRWTLIVAPLLALAAAYLFLEANERAHLAFAPFLALIAPIAFARLGRVAWTRARAEAMARDAASRSSRRSLKAAIGAASDAARPPAAPKLAPEEVAAKPVEERLAMVLRGMSKPPRPVEGEAASSQTVAEPSQKTSQEPMQEPAREPARRRPRRNASA